MIGSSHCFFLILKILTPVGVDLDLNLSFLVTVNVAILWFTVCTSDFQGSVDQESHSQLFVSFSSQEYTFIGPVSIFFF